MKNLVDYINESLVAEGAFDKLKNLWAKIVCPGIGKEDKWLKDYTLRKEVIDVLLRVKDKEDEFAIELIEHGFAATPADLAFSTFKTEDKARKALDSDTNWIKSKHENDLYFFLPGIDALGMKIEDVDTDKIAKEAKEWSDSYDK